MSQFKLIRLLSMMWLYGTIATNSKIELLKSLQEYEIIYPRIISNRNENYRRKRSILQDTITENEGLEEPLFLEISNWTLKTTKNDRLILSSNFTVEWIYSREKKSSKYGRSITDCNLRQGRLEGGAYSLVVVTICKNQVYALILIDKKSFFVQPLTDGQHIMYETKNIRWRSSRKFSDIVSVTREYFQADLTEIQKNKKKKKKKEKKRKRRESTTYYTRQYYNLSDDVFHIEYPQEEKLILYDDKEELPSGSDDDDDHDDNDNDDALTAINVTERLSSKTEFKGSDDFTDSTWHRNKMPKRKAFGKESSPRWLELGIAADYSVVDFHGIHVQQYILALLNIVSAIYMDPSLESNMVLVIARIILYAEKQDSMVSRGDARRSLENVNKWNRKMLSIADVSHDVAVWLTRLDIGGPSGYAPVSGVCDPSRSCALNRDEGLTSAFIIAHEVAHIKMICKPSLRSLGLTHDGDESTGNACKEEGSRGSVMAPMVAATFHHFYWSVCSKKEFHKKVKRWSCLLNQPYDGSSTQLKATVQKTFTMDEQCRIEFGQGYELCKSFAAEEPCSHLWCSKVNISEACKTKKGPPLEGTLCGDSKWCINGRCQPMDEKKFDFGVAQQKPRDGGWGVWGVWEKCSRTCGIGVQCRRRKCNDPQPAYGGRYCSGPSDNCKLCELPKCSAPVDLRAQQCIKFANVLYFERTRVESNLGWLPYEPDQEKFKCQLICRSKETGEIFYTKRNLIDGTPCSYGTTNICIQGECNKMGCDNVLGSMKAFDACGTCQGDGSNCENMTGKFQRKLAREVTRVAVIPREAHYFSMNVTLYPTPYLYIDDLSIVVGDGRRRRNLQENLTSRKRETRHLAIVQGAAFKIKKVDNEMYSVRANGSTFEDVVILLVVPQRVAAKQETVVSVSWKYFLNRDERNRTRDRYVWAVEGWSFCSATCGGGTRQKMVHCKDEKTDRIVSRRKCHLTEKPAQETEKCNMFSCKFKWLPGPWEGCSATCGTFGTQSRKLYCVHSEFNDTEVNKNNKLYLYQVMVQPSLCKNSPTPVNSKQCNRFPCPGHWIFTEWSSCSGNRGRAIQSRIAHCVPPEGQSFSSCNGGLVVKTEIRPCSEHVAKPRDTPCWKVKNRFRPDCCRSCETNKP